MDFFLQQHVLLYLSFTSRGRTILLERQTNLRTRHPTTHRKTTPALTEPTTIAVVSDVDVARGLLNCSNSLEKFVGDKEGVVVAMSRFVLAAASSSNVFSSYMKEEDDGLVANLLEDGVYAGEDVGAIYPPRNAEDGDSDGLETNLLGDGVYAREEDRGLVACVGDGEGVVCFGPDEDDDGLSGRDDGSAVAGVARFSVVGVGLGEH